MFLLNVSTALKGNHFDIFICHVNRDGNCQGIEMKISDRQVMANSADSDQTEMVLKSYQVFNSEDVSNLNVQLFNKTK